MTLSTQRQNETRRFWRKDHGGVDLISDVLPFGRLWYGEPHAITDAIRYAKFRSRSDRAVICVYDDAGNVVQTHEHRGRFQRAVTRIFPVDVCICVCNIADSTE